MCLQPPLKALLRAIKKHFKPEIMTEDWTEIIKVFVGPEKKEFNIHKKTICSDSPFFDKCVNSSFKEGQTGEVHLEEDDSSAFNLIVSWLYKRRIKKCHSLAREVLYVKAWILAEKLMMYDIQDTLMDAIREGHWHSMMVSDAAVHLPQKIWQTNSLLRTYYLDQLAYDIVRDPHRFYTGDRELRKNIRDIFRHEEGDRVAEVQRRAIRHEEGGESPISPCVKDGCCYHGHGKARTCYILRRRDEDDFLSVVVPKQTRTSRSASSSPY